MSGAVFDRVEARADPGDEFWVILPSERSFSLPGALKAVWESLVLEAELMLGDEGDEVGVTRASGEGAVGWGAADAGESRGEERSAWPISVCRLLHYVASCLNTSGMNF
jgi:hypothetical protein